MYQVVPRVNCINELILLTDFITHFLAMPQYIESTNINYEIPKPKMKTAATNDDPVILRCVADVPQCKNISSTERFHSLFVI